MTATQYLSLAGLAGLCIIILCQFYAIARLRQALVVEREYSAAVLRMKGLFTHHIKEHERFAGMPVVSNPNVPKGKLFVLNPETIETIKLDPGSFTKAAEGDPYEATLLKYGPLQGPPTGKLGDVS